jgi:hypothetical protein
MTRILSVSVLVMLSLGCGTLTAQNASQTTMPPPSSAATSKPVAGNGALPDAPSPNPSQPASDSEALQTKRILGVIPNFRAVSTTNKLPPQTVKEKFVTATEDSFDYSSVAIPAVLAGYSLGTNATPEFGHGASGYGQYLWHSAVDQTIENYLVEFVVPVMTHQDTRFYTLEYGGFLKRTGYALSRAVITRSDSGESVFNTSEVVGAGAAAGISNFYYPERQRSFGNTSRQWGINVAVDGAAFVAKEFWPDINRHLFHDK